MNQAEIDYCNRELLRKALGRITKGELIAAIVTVRTNAKGIGWYPAIAYQSGDLLDMLRKKPDAVTIEGIIE